MSDMEKEFSLHEMRLLAGNVEDPDGELPDFVRNMDEQTLFVNLMMEQIHHPDRFASKCRKLIRSRYVKPTEEKEVQVRPLDQREDFLPVLHSALSKQPLLGEIKTEGVDCYLVNNPDPKVDAVCGLLLLKTPVSIIRFHGVFPARVFSYE